VNSTAKRPRNRKDHWLPQGYLRGFVGPSHGHEDKPLRCFFKDTEQWENVSAVEIGYDVGFYDYAAGTDISAAKDPDSTFGRLEREFPSHREAMAARSFANWQDYRDFLLEFAEMLALRSPLGMEHLAIEARGLRGATVAAVDYDRHTITPDSVEMRPLPERAVRNIAVTRMLQKVENPHNWTAKLDWCLRFTDVEGEGFCTNDQAVSVEGPLQLTDEHRRITEDILRHPDALVYFPLCWQACLFGSPRYFEQEYGRSTDIHVLRAKQKEFADKFVVSPVVF
jgi:hypothetical protein